VAREVEAGRMRPCTDRSRPLLERSELDLLDEGWQALRQRAQCDPVTGLPNRRGFLASLARIDGMPHAPAHERWIGLVQFDTLRMVGARCGVDAAESLLHVLVAQAREALGPDARLASHGDDTLAFAVAARDGVDGEPAAAALLERLRDHPFEHGEERYRIGVHIGLARFVPGRDEPEEAIGRAESACAAAREQGRNRVQVHERSSRELRSQESLVDWAGRLDRLLEGDGLFLRCQRIQPIGGDPALVPYFEVLLGIDSADGNAGPSDFVAAVERLKRSHELDLWVMRHTLDWIDANPAVFDSIGGFAINVSPRSLDSPEILGFLHQRLGRLGPDAAKLTFELTENSAIACYGAAQDFIRQVRRYGCRFSLDDFGSGYASYAHLKNLRTDVLKIDGSFVRDIATNPSDLAMVRSMHEVARSLGMRTVAEYAESHEILDMLRAIGIDYGQGWAIHAACRMDALADATDTLILASVPSAATAAAA
jgi:EAL domain-containing protein (putative c-di-GMP-specific phosphodiesterase class I)/GGDEF domain-containing protein